LLGIQFVQKYKSAVYLQVFWRPLGRNLASKLWYWSQRQVSGCKTAVLFSWSHMVSHFWSWQSIYLGKECPILVVKFHHHKIIPIVFMHYSKLTG